MSASSSPSSLAQSRRAVASGEPDIENLAPRARSNSKGTDSAVSAATDKKPGKDLSTMALADGLAFLLNICSSARARRPRERARARPDARTNEEPRAPPAFRSSSSP